MKGRKPACNSYTLPSVDLFTSGSDNEKYITFEERVGQVLPSGNRIGHRPLKPKIFSCPPSHTRPITITEVIKNFSESYFKAKFNKALYHHLDKEGHSIRLIRSEFREMISMGCSLITHYYNVATGELGFINDKGQSIRLSYEFIAEKLNVSLQRVKRFFAFLKARKFITIIEDKQKDNKGEWSSNISRKIINPSFFIETLGIEAWRKLTQFKEWMQKKSKPKTKKQKDNMNAMKNLFNNISNQAKKLNSSYVKKTQRIDSQKNLIGIAMQMHERDSSKSVSDYLRALQESHGV